MYAGSVVKIYNHDTNPLVWYDRMQPGGLNSFTTHSVLEKNPKDHRVLGFLQPSVDAVACLALNTSRRISVRSPQDKKNDGE